ncbi:hypothetical protein EJ08DRAFT_666213 [Tothia fuscella]|uniref:Uncharacterized protein n=1 Tax=Tothia fuscella TaxID=1048955 RepID=A0A9P4NFB6_9PEZI|nr:hypothetical protein EJ08DRAFT_666213 [Tothia fuscella]
MSASTNTSRQPPVSHGPRAHVYTSNSIWEPPTWLSLITRLLQISQTDTELEEIDINTISHIIYAETASIENYGYLIFVSDTESSFHRVRMELGMMRELLVQMEELFRDRWILRKMMGDFERGRLCQLLEGGGRSGLREIWGRVELSAPSRSGA